MGRAQPITIDAVGLDAGPVVDALGDPRAVLEMPRGVAVAFHAGIFEREVHKSAG